ncbi:universal stress protein [Saccharopolyspora phatthalungensis]|uniref:Nucleotide-binding universal stress UspA family protein n=1 Tax=Saccharopolyspora phatthalungensis TaxID=664693 RepID=A0A840QJ12_9PSEU|nr:universal stress protein [Saccharopolyspora phatthalungensis]MBB5157523.1 nucleotide-binding universal stress UspA family protein [Saccharopolyspora phatthalungensis]
MTANGPVVVGVDGSERSWWAAAWATGEADLRGAKRVRAVAVTEDPLHDDEAWESTGPVVDQLAVRYPNLDISLDVVHGHPADVLCHLSTDAQLVVVGSRGRSTLSATLLGSVSAQVATHAHCPVVVVKDHHDSGPVVVGLDNSPYSRSALEFAYAAASRYDSELVAVQVWADVEYAPVVPRMEDELIDLRDEALRGLAEQLAGWAESYPNVAVRNVAQRGHPVAELAAAADEARLLVVGHRGRGGFTGLLLGSVAAGVLHHARSPVAVVR